MASLSPDDFGRLQTQLLELREKNYSLEDSLRKHKKELTDTKTRLQSLEEENGRYQTLIRTSKKASEVELLVRDNGYLRNKLRDQEEDFRLQNNTLLQELSRLVGENERYERQVEVLCGDRSGNQAADGDHGSTDDSKEVLRLRGELTAMEKKLYETEKHAEVECHALKEKMSSLNLHITQLTNILKTHSIPVDEGEISLAQGGGVIFKKLTLQDDDGLETHLEGPSETLQHYQERTSQLQCEVERAFDQLKGEKELVLNLTSEKVKLQQDLKIADERTELDVMQTSLEETYNDLVHAKSSLSEKTAHCETLLKSVEELKQKLEASEKMVQENQNLLTKKEQKLEDIQKNVLQLTSEITHLLEQKKTFERERGELQQEIADLNVKLDSQQAQLIEQTKLAESRRNIIEEMKVHMEDEIQRHKQEVEDISVRHGEEIAVCSTENQQLKNQLQDVNKKVDEVMNLKQIVMSLEQEKYKIETENHRLSEDLVAAHKLIKEEIERVTVEKIQEMEDLKYKWEEEKKDYQTQLEISTIQHQEAEEMVEVLKRKVIDGEEEQRIHERKGMTLLKDLKKQLALERKRGDRLQEKLSQLLTDPSQLTAITTMSEVGDDVSSVSSWSMVSGEPRDSSTRENSIIISPQGSPPPGVVTEETASLVNRVTELQQQKWQLEEQITHLEASSAAMADDLLKKSAIIQHYYMEQKTHDSTQSSPTSPIHPGLGEKLNVRRMLEMMRGSGSEESMREINRRLQSLLEETLTKNMQLHQDVENLSEQVHQLTKLAAEKAKADHSPSLDTQI
ncbi:GRIP1-associated protein 1 isoform X2 [Procambarus clarkii]|uniref:GRIP1-associated protein 1 isoform X2 n=1 Tax=Procambarus clarkii TaxID=6728 RepID=UPI0037424BEE